MCLLLLSTRHWIAVLVDALPVALGLTTHDAGMHQTAITTTIGPLASFALLAAVLLLGCLPPCDHLKIEASVTADSLAFHFSRQHSGHRL